MTDYLVFRLYAPLASWGEAAVGETRPTSTHPGRSAILGLFGAALGIRRDQAEALSALDASLRIGVKQRAAGILMRDYHTTQVPATRPKHVYRTRREELDAPKKQLNTILSSRDYRCDGLWIIAIWLAPNASYTLVVLRNALLNPHFMLYLGRKACPPAAPLAPCCVDVPHLRAALDTPFEPITRFEHRTLNLDEDVLYCWEGEASALDGETHGVESNEVWDAPLSRQRWQFGARVEFRRLHAALSGDKT